MSEIKLNYHKTHFFNEVRRIFVPFLKIPALKLRLRVVQMRENRPHLMH